MNFKKLLFVLIGVFSGIIYSFAYGINQVEIVTIDGIEYICYDNGEAYVNKAVEDTMTTVEILPEITISRQTYTVTKIRSMALYNRKMKSVIIPGTVTTIENEAFSHCINLTSITIPESVTLIEGGAFKGCPTLEKVCFNATMCSKCGTSENPAFPISVEEIIIGEKVMQLPSDAFRNCDGLKRIYYNAILCQGHSHLNPVFSQYVKEVIIGDEVLVIPKYMFSGSKELTTVTFPELDVAIDGFAFYGCTSLETIKLPSPITWIGVYAFQNCSKLASIEIPSSITTIQAGTFKGCTGLKSVTIPETVTKIEQNAFQDCSSLTSITIPDKVTMIENNAFSGCSSLESLTLHEGIKQIGMSAFSGCKLITTITIPESVILISSYAFDGCTALEKVFFNSENCVNCGGGSAGAFPKNVKEVVFGDKVTVIPQYTFASCSGLTSVKISNSVTSIGWAAFKDCKNLDTVIMGKSVCSIDNWAFDNCNAISHVVLTNANNWAKVDFKSSSSNPIYYAKTFTVEGNSEQPLTHLVLDMGNDKVSDYAFMNAGNIKTVVVKGGGISSSAFQGCQSIKSLCVDVNEIEADAFSSSRNLKAVYSLRQIPPAAESSSFNGYSEKKLYVPYGSIKNYAQSEPCWYNFSNIYESDFSELKEIFNFEYESNLENVFFENSNCPVDVYNLSGMRVGDSTDCLPAGCYIVCRGCSICKILVK